MTRRLVARATSETGETNAAPAAIQSACERACRELARWVGPTGSAALLGRALLEAQESHALLKDVRVGSPPARDAILEGIPTAVHLHGATKVAAALEMVLETLVELVSRLVGADLAFRLIDDAAIQSRRDESAK